MLSVLLFGCSLKAYSVPIVNKSPSSERNDFENEPAAFGGSLIELDDVSIDLNGYNSDENSTHRQSHSENDQLWLSRRDSSDSLSSVLRPVYTEWRQRHKRKFYACFIILGVLAVVYLFADMRMWNL